MGCLPFALTSRFADCVPDFVKTEMLRVARTNFSEGYKALVHLKVVRLFVESVLRYGLPALYTGIIVKVSLAFRLQLIPETHFYSISPTKRPQRNPSTS